MDRRDLHLRLARNAQRRLRPAFPDEQPPRDEAELRALEAQYVEAERSAAAAEAARAPSDPQGFVAWFESLRESGPGQGDRVVGVEVPGPGLPVPAGGRVQPPQPGAGGRHHRGPVRGEPEFADGASGQAEAAEELARARELESQANAQQLVRELQTKADAARAGLRDAFAEFEA